MKLVLATRNPGKIRELRAFLQDTGIEVLGLDSYPHAPEVVEDGLTFRDNALKKARAIAAHTGLSALADDSGLEVDALGGKPGVFSARFAGLEADDRANNAKLLEAMRGVPPGARAARYRAVLALVLPGDGALAGPGQGQALEPSRGPGQEVLREGVSEGEILTEPRGSRGFGYDPLFHVPALGKTFAELDPEERMEVSHRFRALRELRPVLEQLLAHVTCR